MNIYSRRYEPVGRSFEIYRAHMRTNSKYGQNRYTSPNLGASENSGFTLPLNKIRRTADA